MKQILLKIFVLIPVLFIPFKTYGSLPTLLAKVFAPLLAAVLAGIGYNHLTSNTAPKELRWDWNRIDTDKQTHFPKDFKFGAASAEYQVSGSECYYTGDKRTDCPESNWSRYQKAHTLFGNSVIESSGRGIDHWNRSKEDIQLIKDLGVSVYRCSIEWARIQPRQEYFDEEAIAHYHTLFDEARRQGLELMVTLHHFVNPAWFDDRGGFEKEENIQFLVAFAERMFVEFGDKVSYWCTINEPGVYAAQTYIMNDFPRPAVCELGFPCSLGRGMCAEGAALVTKHLMMTHLAIYKALKAMPGGDMTHIGIVHNIIHFEAYHPGNWFETKLANILKQVYCEAITQFLLTGQLQFNTFTDTVTFSCPTIKDEMDFVGLNYYSHVLLDWMRPWAPQVRPEDGESLTDMYYGLYAEGIYRAIMELAPIGKPIYITENGLADADDNLRDLWYRRYLYAVSKAIADGADVRMFCAWSVFDNFEWNLGYAKQFGLYHVDMKTYNRTLKDGAKYFQKLAKDHTDKQKSVE